MTARVRRAAFRLRLSLAGSRSPYQYLADALRWWPLGLPDRPRRDAPTVPHVGYLLWRYPMLSETMIQREIEALRRAGLRVTVLAEEPEPGATPLSPLAGQDVVYLADGGAVASEVRPRTRPLRRTGLLLYVISRRYGPAKTLREDRRLFRAAVRVAERASELGIDHLHAPWAGREAFVALVAARFAAIPYSVQARAYELHRPDAVWALSEKIGHAKFAVTNSDFNREHLRRLIGQRAASVHRIYNGVDPDRLRSEAPRADGQPPLLLAIGRVVPQKGFDVLLEACALLRGRGHAFRCHIVGARQPMHGNHWVALRRLHAHLDLGDDVRFVGPRPFSEVNDAYGDADMFVLPCVAPPGDTHDVTPNVLIEAMAMELPVVSTPIGGIPEIIDHDENGLLVPAGDASALADTLEQLLGNPQLRRRLGAGARDKVHARFDIRSNAERYMRLFCGDVPRHHDTAQRSAASAYAGEATP